MTLTPAATLNPMNESPLTIRLRSYLPGPDAWGRDQGQQVQERLREVVDKKPSATVVVISLDGVVRTDSSFPRVAVVMLAEYYRRQRGICLVDLTGEDLFENWDAAAQLRQYPLFVWQQGGYRIIGPQPSEGTRDMLIYVLRQTVTTASEAAAQLGISVQNASNKLKQLWEGGYILRRERAASTGGVEYMYAPIR